MGATVLEAIDARFAVDVATMTDEQRIDEMRETRCLINRFEGRYLELLEKVDRAGMIAAEHGSTQAWLRTEPLVDFRTAGRMVRLARDLADVFHATAAKLRAGEITPEHARVITKLRKHASPESLAKVEPGLADIATKVGVQELNDAVESTIHSLKPEQKVQDERTAFDRRELHMSSSLDGVGYGNWTLDPVTHDAVATAIHAASEPTTDDLRNPAQRRADGLATIARFFLKHATGDDGLPSDHGTAPQVTVICPLDTLLGMAGASTATTGTGATVSGDAARRIACDAGVSRIVTGPASEILDAGRTMRTFTTATRRAVVARDLHCRWKGCSAPASWCETHHIIHWADGGESNPENAILLCGRHHDRLHNHKHQVVIKPDGTRTVDLCRDSAKEGWLDDQRKPPDKPPD